MAITKLKPLARWLIKKAYGDKGYVMLGSDESIDTIYTMPDNARKVDIKVIGAGGWGGDGSAPRQPYTVRGGTDENGSWISRGPIEPIETNGIKGYAI